MESLKQLVSRDLTDDGSIINMMIVLLSLLFFALLMVAVLVLLRRMRRQQQMRAQTLPQYNSSTEVKRSGNHRGLTIHTSNMATGRSSVIVFKDGQPMLANPASPPHSPDNVPEIHITFPDEQDEHGRQKSGRVVVVRVGETSVGLEPLHDEQLPAYEKESSTQFYAIDIDGIGGLKEKDPANYH